MEDQAIDLQGAKILLVDDTPANLDVLCALLESEGYDLAMASDGPLALKIAERMQPNLILLDVMMPEMDGYEVCRRLKGDPALADIPVIFITGKVETEDVVSGFDAGGVDYIAKPLRDQEVLARVQTQLRLSRMGRTLARQNGELAEKNKALEAEIAERKKLKSQLTLISEQEAQRWGLEGFVGESATIRKIFNDIRLVQDSPSTSVLITGESGTGKELIARAIHFGSPRREAAFIPVNCASMPGELAESLLFGHVKGAFTGAVEDKPGFFELAHEGTLFLDELGEMPLELQAKLLRVLEDGEVWRVGAREGRKVDVRVVAATNVDLERNIQEGNFRQDLFYRVARFVVDSPPLRERREDIPLLAGHFLRVIAAEMGREVPGFSPEALGKLQAYSFPGNVRELKNIVERGLIESRGGDVEVQHLRFIGPLGGDVDNGNVSSGNHPLISLEESERRHIQGVMEATGWAIRGAGGAAQVLGVPESTLRGRLKKLGIERP